MRPVFKAFQVLLTVFAISAMSTSLVGCGIKTEKEEANDLVKEHSQKQSAVNATIADLIANYKINVNPRAEYLAFAEVPSSHDWSSLTPDQLIAVRNKLTLIIANLGRMNEIAAHKNIRTKGDDGAVGRASKRAREYRDSLDAFTKSKV